MSLQIAIAKPDWGINGGYELLLGELSRRLEERGATIRWLMPRVDQLGDYAYGEDIRDVATAVPEYARHLQLVERFSSLDVSRADLVISAMPGAYAVRHPRHLSVFSHHLRSFYDLSDVMIEAGMVRDVRAHLRAAENVRRIDALCLGATPLILATSAEVAGRLERFNKLVHNVALFHAGPGFSGVQPEPSSADAFEHVLCVSRQEFPKRNELFVQAATHFRSVPSIVVGTGGRQGWAMQVAADFAAGRRDPMAPSRPLWCVNAPWIDPRAVPLEGQLRFTGRVDADELDRLYRGALCVVAPAYLEDYGLTAIEAMAYGKPLIVCQDGGNLVNFVEHGVNGFVVEPDGASIAEAVQRFVDDPDLARKLGENGRQLVQPYTWDRAMREFDAGVAKVLAS